jgi:ADP-ribose pyrophosphatase YjhB (NUDIX family)
MSPKVEARSARIGVFKARGASILIVKNSKYDVWELPGGTQWPQEPINWTARRELKEETGLEISVRNLTFAGSTKYWGRKGSFHECILYYTQFIDTKGILQQYPKDENISETKWIDFYNPRIAETMKFHPFSQFALHMLHTKLKVNS